MIFKLFSLKYWLGADLYVSGIVLGKQQYAKEKWSHSLLHGDYSAVFVGISDTQIKKTNAFNCKPWSMTWKKSIASCGAHQRWKAITAYKVRINLCLGCLYRNAVQCWKLTIRCNILNLCLFIAFHIIKSRSSHKTPCQTPSANNNSQKDSCHCPHSQ